MDLPNVQDPYALNLTLDIGGIFHTMLEDIGGSVQNRNTIIEKPAHVSKRKN